MIHAIYFLPNITTNCPTEKTCDGLIISMFQWNKHLNGFLEMAWLSSNIKEGNNDFPFYFGNLGYVARNWDSAQLPTVKFPIGQRPAQS